MKVSPLSENEGLLIVCLAGVITSQCKSDTVVDSYSNDMKYEIMTNKIDNLQLRLFSIC